MIKEESEALSDSSRQEEPEEEEEVIIELPKLKAITRKSVPPKKYKDRSITFEIDYDKLKGVKPEASKPEPSEHSLSK